MYLIMVLFIVIANREDEHKLSFLKKKIKNIIMCLLF